ICPVGEGSSPAGVRARRCGGQGAAGVRRVSKATRTITILLVASCAPFALAASEAVEPEAEPATIPVEGPVSDAQPSQPEPSARKVLGEIVVTARRTEESLQEVPMSISVMDSTQLVERGITTFHDLTTSVPGLTGGEGQQTAYKPTPIFSI